MVDRNGSVVVGGGRVVVVAAVVVVVVLVGRGWKLKHAIFDNRVQIN